MGDDSGFDARCEKRDGAVVVVARGELDLASADALRSVLRGSDAQAPIVVLDLRAVTFIDSSGLSVIVGHSRRADTYGFRFGIAVGGARTVSRVFDLSGLTETLPIIEDPEAMLAA
jgi:anti-sigma B factor antagonist